MLAANRCVVEGEILSSGYTIYGWRQVPIDISIIGEKANATRPEIEQIMIAKGGDGGFGNMRYKSAINRAPRQKTPGWPGERKNLKLELKVLADVGLLGMPNAGKSTLISAISNARPKIADYPFTTLHPNLGVVRVGPEQSFVVADVPGLIEGASEGAGLGHLFLRHLQRTRLLLHIVDMAPFDESVDPVVQARAIVAELGASGPGDMGKVMGVVKTRLAGKAEMGTVSAAVKTALAG